MVFRERGMLIAESDARQLLLSLLVSLTDLMFIRVTAMTKRIFKGVLFTAFITAGLQFTLAQGTVSQSVTLQVQAVTKIAVSGNPGALVISDAVAGSDLTSVSDNTTSYNITTNTDNMKIVASINSPMPVGTRLLLQLGSNRGLSIGSIDMSNAISPVDLVTGISKGSDLNQTISYVFAANADTPAIPSDSRVITLTLTN